MATAWLNCRNIPQPWIDWIKSSIGRNFVRPWKKLSVEKGDGRVHGDSAYRSAQIEKDRKEKAVESRIHEQGYRNRPLTAEQKENNRQKSRVRARIEHVFGYMTNSMGGIFLTCIGMRPSIFLGVVRLSNHRPT